jgi:hypothetical protein
LKNHRDDVVGYAGALVFNIEVSFLALSWFRYCHFKYSMFMAKMNGIKKNTLFLLWRTWRKLYLAIDDPTAVPDPLALVPPFSIPSSVMTPTIANPFLKLF